jgi:hypothetical protein
MPRCWRYCLPQSKVAQRRGRAAECMTSLSDYSSPGSCRASATSFSLRAALLPQLLTLLSIGQSSNAKLLRIPLSRKQGAPHELAPLLRINDQRLLVDQRDNTNASPLQKVREAEQRVLVVAACLEHVKVGWLTAGLLAGGSLSYRTAVCDRSSSRICERSVGVLNAVTLLLLSLLQALRFPSHLYCYTVIQQLYHKRHINQLKQTNHTQSTTIRELPQSCPKPSSSPVPQASRAAA